jgi:hypothetical protein
MALFHVPLPANHPHRYVFRVALEAGQRLRRVVPSTAADVERLTRHLADDA